MKTKNLKDTKQTEDKQKILTNNKNQLEITQNWVKNPGPPQ